MTWPVVICALFVLLCLPATMLALHTDAEYSRVLRDVEKNRP